ncbi:SigE family RNA polymerase sigma factor [Amycolatopsis rhizosphaerae]|uniref:SigE family RNA polymerase sigma factor n=1 Tax=Amycolatopsis rhizosphaerae TaxID=2053003 RepID=A0A558DCY6_9PSEU|nr:SigE family RNA polymerase sigma factor [Amycolatopsis rhizosphaerae]TVT58894.1 SigE family RNA polymerase sigma factor [Amycolatopsis rhizosphaerae]
MGHPKGGTEEDFAEFVMASSGRLTHAAFLLTGDRHQAEDAAQTALARTYAAWRRIRHKDAYGYARKVLVNHLIDLWRRPIKESPTDEVPERRVAGAPESAVVTRQWLQELLDGLTGRERAVIVLRHYFDLPEAEVAAELSVSVGTVKSTNSRALAKLRVAAKDDLPTTCGGAA